VTAIPMSVSGVVDAILEVSRQRKPLLDQLRSVLQSGDDAKALQLARQLCGLAG
jgi:conjugal transfer/entry exclusion protein